MSSLVDDRSANEPEVIDDPRGRRRSARVASNRNDILDAAERVFAGKGPTAGSLRDIAKAAGFSTAAIYNYFENKQDLLEATLLRRSVALDEALQSAAAGVEQPLDKLHAIVDAAITFFGAYPDFRRLLNHGPVTDEALGHAIAELAVDNADIFTSIVGLIIDAIIAGQAVGRIREGNPVALSRLFMALVNEHVVLSSGPDQGRDGLTSEQFHDLVDGAFRSRGGRL